MNDTEKMSVENVLAWNNFSIYISEFNEKDEEIYANYIPNSDAELFLKENIPYFNCPDKELERTYYFRWWIFRKHIKKSPEGFVITEFLPEVPWAAKYNTISCPAGHHFYEGRWLHNSSYLHDYANFWFKGGGEPRKYSFWAANSILAFACVHQDKDLLINLLPYLDKNYQEWEKANLCDDGLFQQIDDRDGMEVSIGGSGKRATINSYMYGDAKAIAVIAGLAGDISMGKAYNEKASMLQALILNKLWNVEDNFFETLPLNSDKLVNVRELHGYTPWYFNIPEEKHAIAWKYLLSNEGFKAPYGPTSAEQSHSGFKISYEGHECQWNGPSWPFATSITLKAMGNLLRNNSQSVITKKDFMEQLLTYSNSHRRVNERGENVCWIDENLNPFTGDWISRTILKSRGSEPKQRGKDYNHSAFCDLIISDLIGIQPSMGDKLVVCPLISVDYWGWFCLDRVKYHDKIITIIWDKDGTKYQKGKGFSVFVNGELMKNLPTIEKLVLEI
ncbi:MGH1-like glycoside hydrolase domain-containing protein [Sunxiuqinia sp. A32]|uniref:MGH1-like glycoside hydrolase domain-containing protein n=1 Tax=Sunxiuqinia sp. A32 TaxID=3461496 RepID=UPI0040457D95